MAERSLPPSQTLSRLVNTLYATCVIFTSVTIADHFFSFDTGTIEHLFTAVGAAVFVVFAGPILQAKVVNGQEVENG